MAKARILVVEDEAIEAEDIKSSLLRLGYDVAAMASSGEEAIEKAMQSKPDLVLMDIVLRTRMTGVEAASEIRSRLMIPVVFLTAHAGSETLERAKAAEPFGYIVKPFEPREMQSAIDIALHKSKTEEVLRESEKKYRMLFENAADMIYLIDLDGEQIIDCNRTAIETVGYTCQELMGMQLQDLFPKEERPIVSDILQKSATAGVLSGVSGINHLAKDGRFVPVEINAAALELKGGKYGVWIVRDVTERKKVEEILRVERNKLTSILDAMEDGVYIVNKRFQIEYANPAVTKEFGEVNGRKCHEYFRGCRDVCRTCQNEEVFKGNTVRWEWFSGVNEKYYDVIDTPLANPDGSVSKLAILRDNTERRKMEQEIAGANEQWERTFDSVPDLILITDSRYRIVRVNRAMAERLGVDRADLLGKLCHEALHGMPAPPDFCPRRGTVDRGKEFVREVYEKNLNGYFLLSSTPIVDSEGRVSAVVEVARDITDRKMMEERLREAAITDDLTGLLNRRGFFAFSGQQYKAADRAGRHLSLLYLDIDNMKTINDRLGHETGDQALKDTATILKSTFRTSDIIGRVGGDEFAVLLTDQTRRDIEKIVKSNLRKNVQVHNESARRKYELSISMGVAQHGPEHPVPVEELVADADKLMYEDKSRKMRGRKIQ